MLIRIVTLVSAVMVLSVGCGMAEKLANPGIDTKFHNAVAEGDLDKAEELLRDGADINARFRLTGGQTTLTMAATADVKIVTWLLEHGADPNAVTDSGRTPLMQAAKGGHIDQVRILLAHGADVSVRTKEGETALTLARSGGHDEVAAALETAEAEG